MQSRQLQGLVAALPVVDVFASEALTGQAVTVNVSVSAVFSGPQVTGVTICGFHQSRPVTA